jgi:hypothetical protein
MITASRLRRLLSYSKSTGLLRWRESLSPRVRVGSVAGSVSEIGLRIVQIAGRKYLGHRIAVLHVSGKWPAHNIKFKNGDKSDTRWRNLKFA